MERSRLRLPVEQTKPNGEQMPMSSKQLYNSVKNGQRITFVPFDSDEITGYLAGMDDDYFFVVEPKHDGFETSLLYRATCPVCKIHKPHTFGDEQFRVEMDEIIHKFRTWVLRKVFGQKSRVDAENNLEGVAR